MKTPHLVEINSGDQASMKLNASQWRLPSGRPLGEYALQAGFIAPRLWTPAKTETVDDREGLNFEETPSVSFAPYRRRPIREIAVAPAREC